MMLMSITEHLDQHRPNRNMQDLESLLKAWVHHCQLPTPVASSQRPLTLAVARNLCRQTYSTDPCKFHPEEATSPLQLCRQTSCFIDVSEQGSDLVAQGGDIEAYTTHLGIGAAERAVAIPS